jgi:choline-sulfatase
MPGRPNVLLVMSDQHHKSILRCAGDGIVRTPAMDALARRGTRFANAYCDFPLCLPSRMSFMTGRHPHRIDCFTNHAMLGSDVPTFAHAFLAGGYETVLAGRMHFIGSDQRHGFERRLVADCQTPYINLSDWGLGPVLGALADTPGYEDAGIIKSGPGHTGYHAYDETVCAAAETWLHERSTGSRPFLLVVGLVSPHCPFVAPPEHYRPYRDAITASDLPDDGGWLHPRLRPMRDRLRALPQDAKLRTRRAYYGLVSYTDALLARVLDALERSGRSRDTIVVYTSDHGEMLGEHGLWWKNTFYEGSVGVPLIVALPDDQHERVTGDPIALSDLGPTLLSLVGLPPLPGVDGRDFSRAVRGVPAGVAHAVLAEYAEAWGGRTVQRMVRQGSWKYIYHHGDSGGEEELFDLADDPGEIRNKAGDPAHRPQLERLRATALRGWDPERIAHRLETIPEEMRLIWEWIARAKPADPDPPWYGKELPRNVVLSEEEM